MSAQHSGGGGSPVPSEKPTPRSKRHGKTAGGAETAIGVFARFRPLNATESQRAHDHDVDPVEYQQSQVVIREGGAEKKFIFDGVFDPTAAQAQVYDVVARETVESIVHGYNGTIFAYGQTGSGKSYSMMGPEGSGRASPMAAGDSDVQSSAV